MLNVLKIIGNTPSIRDILTVRKIEKIIKGLDKNLDYDQRQKLKKDFLSGENREEKIFRVLQIIDKIDTEEKIDYFTRAILSLVYNKINIDEFFRIIVYISNILSEDLEFFKEKYSKYVKNNKEQFSDCYQAQALVGHGLMYQSVYDGGGAEDDSGEQLYSFTSSAKLLYIALDNDWIRI